MRFIPVAMWYTTFKTACHQPTRDRPLQPRSHTSSTQSFSLPNRPSLSIRKRTMAAPPGFALPPGFNPPAGPSSMMGSGSGSGHPNGNQPNGNGNYNPNANMNGMEGDFFGQLSPEEIKKKAQKWRTSQKKRFNEKRRRGGGAGVDMGKAVSFI